MSKKIIIDTMFPNETRVALLSNDNNIDDIEFDYAARPQNKGNIYLAKITKIEPSLQAAFIDYGNDKSGFLPFVEINPDYYHIPVADQKSLVHNLKEIEPTQVMTDDRPDVNLRIIDNDEIDLSKIEELIDTKSSSTFDIESSDVDVETISTPLHESSHVQKHYKIQEVIKKGQILLVQLVKEERGNKGASFSTYISLAGKYCVLMPNRHSQNGISRKISNVDERKRLKNIIEKLTSDAEHSFSVVVRTAGIGRTGADITRDYNYLVRLWNKIREVTLKSIAPCFIHQEEGIIQKTIRDMCDHNVKELIIQGASAYQSAVKFMKEILPTDVYKVKEYKNKVPIFTKFAVEDQLSKLYQPVVSLKSGGYIVIHPTEALISIDINSGKATSERNIEETALKINIEAAKEIARQVRLRDLSGLLVIDFIDMHEGRHRRIVERSIKEFLSRDRARIQISNISNFGLLEMSRQRLRPSFLELHAIMCTHCNGKGIIRAHESNAMLILRTVENEICNDNDVEIVNIFASSDAVIYLLNNQRKEIAMIEEKYAIKLHCYCDTCATADSYSIEKIRNNSRPVDRSRQDKPALQNTDGIYQSKSVTEKHNKKKWKDVGNNVVDNDVVMQDSEELQSSDNLNNHTDQKHVKTETQDQAINTVGQQQTKMSKSSIHRGRRRIKQKSP